MNLSKIGALLSRALGVISVLIGLLFFINYFLTYQLIETSINNDIFFVVSDSIILCISFIVIGLLAIVFSKAVGRLLAKGLE